MMDSALAFLTKLTRGRKVEARIICYEDIKFIDTMVEAADIYFKKSALPDMDKEYVMKWYKDPRRQTAGLLIILNLFVK